MKSLQELTDLVDALRARGVYHFRQGDLEIHISATPEAPLETSPFPTHAGGYRVAPEKPEEPGWRGYSQEERDLLGAGD